MNAYDVLKYGHIWVHKHVVGLTDEQWEAPGVCGWWSVKNIIAHLASFEHVLVDVLEQCLEGGPTPALDEYKSMDGSTFNDIQVGRRKARTPRETLEEYDQAQAKAMELIPRIPAETLRQPGTLPWYGMEYSIEDYIVYAFYGHKREHCAQIAVYRNTLK